MTEAEYKRMVALVAENIERVEWTLKDPDWKPTRGYLQKLLSAYKAHTDILLANVPPYPWQR